jgi:hypothetical protein
LWTTGYDLDWQRRPGCVSLTRLAGKEFDRGLHGFIFFIRPYPGDAWLIPFFAQLKQLQRVSYVAGKNFVRQADKGARLDGRRVEPLARWLFDQISSRASAASYSGCSHSTGLEWRTDGQTVPGSS